VGTGTSLGNQGALALSDDHSWLFAVNTGDNSVTVFSVGDWGLTWKSKTTVSKPSPISLDVHGATLLVLSINGIATFHIGEDGSLWETSSWAPPAATPWQGPAEVKFSHDGTRAVVSVKGTSKLLVFTLASWTLTTAPAEFASSGATPFGFDIDQWDRVFVAEAGPSALSSYQLTAAAQLNVITASRANGQGAACWAIVTPNGKWAYTANAAPGTISAYTIATDGSVTLASAIAGWTGSHPVDFAVSWDGAYLYNLANGGGSRGIWSYKINVDGTLQAAESLVDGWAVPGNSTGLLAWTKPPRYWGGSSDGGGSYGGSNGGGSSGGDSNGGGYPPASAPGGPSQAATVINFNFAGMLQGA